MSELAHTDEVVTKQYVAELYQQLLPYLSSSLMVKTGVSEYYSTDERVIGAWFGKPLYQKSIYLGSMPNSTNAKVHHNISNIEQIVNTIGFWYTESSGTPNGWGVLPRPGYANNQYFINVDYDATDIILYTASDQTSRKGYITLQYTKSTDAAGSATATAGAYDISRPDTWPANTEIYFGKGLYGYRASGNYAANKGANEAGIVNFGITAYRIQSCGGGFEVLNASGNRVFRTLGPTVSTGSVQTVFAGDITIGATNMLVAGFNTGTDTVTTAQTYDLWVTYNKP